MKHPGLLLLLFVFALLPRRAAAQCGTVVSSFPYQEDFEVSDGNWVTGGANSDWVWGTPAKRVINRAYSGIRCWITGGLQNTRYNDNENSWLRSPCFNFTGLTNPYINFRVFWETERRYDGASLEYSTNGGVSWILLGSSADNSTCPGNNWFNTQNITALGTDGWSGNVQPTAPCPNGNGAGSGNWVAAARSLRHLAGLPSVQFRFRFAAGNRCNDYDGFAVDDIWIGDLQPAAADFSFTCANDRQANFSALATECGSLFSWDFGDPASGSSNTAVGPSPSHSFSGPGIYQVRITMTSPGGATSVRTKEVRILSLRAEQLSAVRCRGGREASMTVEVQPAGTYNYQWSTTPAQQTPTVGQVGAGSYTIDVTADNACPARTSLTITEPQGVSHTRALRDARCGGANGAVELTPAGGSAPYTFEWSGAAGAGPSSTQLPPGAYRVIIRDALGCSDTARFTIGNDTRLSVSLGSDTVLCAGESLLLNPGAFAAYRWQDGSTAPTFAVQETGLYSVQVTDSTGCRASASVRVTADCSDVFFPTAFSPNRDGRNDGFGPLGNRSGLSDYHLRVYGRWGQLVFESRNPLQAWDGRTAGGKDASQVYVWIAEYRLVRHPGRRTRKGTVLLLR